MQKIKDIHAQGLDPSVDTRNPKRVISPKVSQAASTQIDEITSGKGSIISFAKKYPVKLQKKTGKHFDALEKKSAFSKIFSMRDIDIASKNRFSVSQFFGYKISKVGLYLKGFHPVTLGLFFVMFLGLYAITSKVIIENRVNAGYEKILSLKDGVGSLELVQKNINNARFDLLLADILFVPFRIIGGEKIDSVGHVISGGRFISKGLDDSLALYAHTNKYVDSKDIKNIYFTQLLLNISPNLLGVEDSLSKALLEYQSISWLPNTQIWEQKNIGQEYLEKMLSFSNGLNEQFPDFLNILGHDSRKRYLIVFQNADEIRPTGGFMGSMGLLEIFRGKVQLFQKKDVYAIEWDLKKADYERLPAPKGISELTDTFGLRDANYYANLGDSSNAIKFFTDRAGINLDGIIYINQNTLLHLLEKTGPVYFEPLDRDITSENFSELMSLAVEAKTFKQGTLGTPKQVLFDFMQVFISELTQSGDYFDYAQTIFHDIDSRDIMLWSFNEDHSKLLSNFGVNGYIDYNQSLDHFYPIYTSLSGNKSDRYMKRNYVIDVNSRKDSCDYEVNFQIRSTHGMNKTRRDDIENFINEYKLSSPNLFKIQGAAKNRQYVRVIIPSMTSINQEIGTEIVDYGRRKGLEFFIETELGETSIYENSYVLENPKCEDYSTTLFKQPGIPEFGVRLSIDGEIHNYDNLQEDFYFEDRS